MHVDSEIIASLLRVWLGLSGGKVRPFRTQDFSNLSSLKKIIYIYIHLPSNMAYLIVMEHGFGIFARYFLHSLSNNAVIASPATRRVNHKSSVYHTGKRAQGL